VIAIPSRFADPESLPLTQLLEKRASQESEFFLGTIIPFVGKNMTHAEKSPIGLQLTINYVN